MKNFNFRRFGLLLKRDLLGNSKKYLLLLAGMFIVYFLVELTLFYFPSVEGGAVRYAWEEPWARLLERAAVNFSAVSLCLFVFGMSPVFDTLKTKEQRVDYLMLPATRMEKFVSRWFLSVVMWSVGAFVTFVAADLVRMLVFPLLGHSIPSAVPAYVQLLWDEGRDTLATLAGIGCDGEDCLVMWIGVLLYLSVHSAYLLGSAFFRKQPFICTSVAGILLLTLQGFALPLFKAIAHQLLSPDVFWMWLYFILLLLLCFVVACYWLSYRLFSRVQVIQSKWFNV